MITMAGAALLLSATSQMPDECAGVVAITPEPFCFAATFVQNLGSMATAYRFAAESIAVASNKELEEAVRTVVYWNLERRRVGRRACSELSVFRPAADSTGLLLIDSFCNITHAMTTSDSAALADNLADLENPQRRTVVERATAQANRRQYAEQLNRMLVSGSMLMTFVLIRTDTVTGHTSLLALRPDQHRWLVDRLRAVTPRGTDTGVFGQIGSVLADWLDEPGWRFLPPP